MANEAISHAAKCRALFDLCQTAAALDDTRIQGYLARYFAIMIAAYVEIHVREVLVDYAKRRSSPYLAAYLAKTIEWENSLNCEKISIILTRFGKSVADKWTEQITDDERNAIDSVKTLRDQLAHGRDNGTSYVILGHYFKHVCAGTEKIALILP